MTGDDQYVREPAGTGRFAEHAHAAPEMTLSAPPAPLVETNRRIRGHKFVPSESRKWPSIEEARRQSVDSVRIHAHYFVGAADWYVAGYDPQTHTAFGYACIGDPMNAEWGEFSLAELEAVRVGIYKQPIERDCYYKSKQTGADAMQEVRSK